MVEQIVSLIGKMPFFSLLGEDERRLVAERARTVSFDGDKTIFIKGSPGSTLYIILKGKVKIVLPSSEFDKKAIVAILSEGEMFGELSVFDGRPRSANAVAIEQTQALQISRKELYRMMADMPTIAQKILTAVSMRLRQADCLVEDACFFDLPARLARRLLNLAENHGKKTSDGIEIPLRLTQQDFAGMIGATRESVNKQIRFYQDRGIIDIENHHVIVIKPEELRKRIY